MPVRRPSALLLALVFAAVNAVPSAAHQFIVPVVAPLNANVGAGLAGAAPTLSLSATLPGLPSTLPTPSLAPALPGVNPVLPQAAPSKAAVAAPAAVAAAATQTQAKPAATVQAGLEALGATLAKSKEAGPAAAAPALSRTFDSAPSRHGDVEAVAVPGAEAAGRPAGALQRSLTAISELRMGTYNVLNLFEKVGKHVPDPDRPGKLKQVSGREAKEDWQLREQGKAILESKLDVVVLQEVENIAALDDFNARFLGGAYRTFLIEANDERGIDVAFLVKKDLPLTVEHRTNKDELWTDPVTGQQGKLFSRDVPEMIFRAEGSAKPLFVLLGTHFKSKRDRPGDPNSEIQRTAQVERTADIVARVRAEFGADVPLMLAGDFNGDVNADAAYRSLYERAGLTNGLDLGDHPVPLEDRVTHTYHPKFGPRHAAQMDAILVSKSLRGLVKHAEVYRYKNADGTPKPIPQTYAEREQNPSDHFPLLLTLAFQALLPAAAPRAPAVNGVLPEAAPARPAGEWKLGALGLAWSFLAIASMYVVMPVRSAFLLTQFGAEVMPWVYMASAAFTGLAAWGYAKASRLPRARFVGGTLAVLAAGLVGWWALAPLAMTSGPLSFAFAMWTDAYAIMSVTLFWSYANDRFRGDAAKRWFGGFAAAGALGGMTGSALTKLLVAGLGTTPLLLIGAGLFAGIGALFWAMERTSVQGEALAPAAVKKDLASPWTVAKLIAASPLLTALTAVVFLERMVPDFSDYLFSTAVKGAFSSREAMTAFLATFGFWENLVSLLTGALLTRWMLEKLGVGKMLLGAPLANLLGFIGFGLSPKLGTAVAANAADGWQRHSWFKAAKETASTAVDKDVLYQVKAYVEMFVYRFARGLAGFSLLMLTGHSFLGLNPTAVAWVGVPLAAAWVYAAVALGREYRKKTAAAPAPSIAPNDSTDLYEPRPLMPAGKYKGQPIETGKRRALTILPPAEAARYAPKEGEVVAANFSHAGKFWVAKFPKDAVEKLIFQKWDFGGTPVRLRLFGRTLLDFHLFHLAHTELRFTLKPGTAITLYSQERGASAEPVHSITDLVSSVEAVGPKQARFGVMSGLFHHFVAVRRFKSLAQDVDERITGDRRLIEQWDLDISDAKKQTIFAAAIADSDREAMRTPYHIFFHSCTTEAFKIIDQAMDYGLWAWESVIFRHIPLFPEAYLWARGLLKPGGLSRMPTLNDEVANSNPHSPNPPASQKSPSPG